MSQTELALDVIRKKVFFHNSVDVWISACEEKNIEWNNTESYKKFISYLLKNNLQLKAFNLCAHEMVQLKKKKQNSLNYYLKRKIQIQMLQLTRLN